MSVPGDHRGDWTELDRAVAVATDALQETEVGAPDAARQGN